MTPDFLSVDDVLRLHHLSARRYGGAEGVRDRGLLEAAVMAPQASFGGEWLLDSLIQMAASYLVGLVGNHPFVDGNKRTAWVIARTFLALNGVSLDFDALEAITFVESVAAGAVDRAEATIWFVERIA